MKVYEAIADIVRREGVEVVFAVMGDANMKWLGEYSRQGGRVIYARHEGSAIGMADGYARATGKLSVCSVTCGPGLSLLATALVAASRARTPVLTIAGDAPRGDKYYEQAFDQRRFVEASETIAQELRSPLHLDQDLRDSFYLTRTAGPVVFSAPFDLQNEETGPREGTYAPSAEMVPARQDLVPDAGAVERAAAVLRRSERPIVIAGRGGVTAKPEIEALADATGALLSTTMLAKGLFDGDARDLGMAGGFTADAPRALFGRADCVIGVGAGLNHYTTDHGRLFPHAEVIHVVEDAAALMTGRRRPHARPGGVRVADHYVRGTAAVTVQALAGALGGVTRDPWAEPPPPPAPAPPEPDDPDLHPAEVMAALNEAAARDTRFVIGLGHNWWFPLTYLRGWSADAFQLTTEFGAIGQGLISAIGTAVGRPDRKTVLVEGDGSVMMAVQELDTAARYGLDLLVVVMNDRGLGAEAHKLEALGFDPDEARMRAPDFAGMARALGGEGERVETLDAFSEAVTRFQREGGVRLVDAQISQRVMSDPYVKAWGRKPHRRGET